MSFGVAFVASLPVLMVCLLGVLACAWRYPSAPLRHACTAGLLLFVAAASVALPVVNHPGFWPTGVTSLSPHAGRAAMWGTAVLSGLLGVALPMALAGGVALFTPPARS